MEQRDDRLLKELYNEARHDDGEAPDFEVMLARARTKRSPWSGRASWVAAAAAVLVIVAAAFVLRGTPEPEMMPALNGEVVALNGDDSWEELIDWADELWEEEFPSDFLL